MFVVDSPIPARPAALSKSRRDKLESFTNLVPHYKRNFSHATAQRRKALPRFDGFRCAVAPLRENPSRPKTTFVFYRSLLCARRATSRGNYIRDDSVDLCTDCEPRCNSRSTTSADSDCGSRPNDVTGSREKTARCPVPSHSKPAPDVSELHSRGPCRRRF